MARKPPKHQKSANTATHKNRTYPLTGNSSAGRAAAEAGSQGNHAEQRFGNPREPPAAQVAVRAPANFGSEQSQAEAFWA